MFIETWKTRNHMFWEVREKHVFNSFSNLVMTKFQSIFFLFFSNWLKKLTKLLYIIENWKNRYQNFQPSYPILNVSSTFSFTKCFYKQCKKFMLGLDMMLVILFDAAILHFTWYSIFVTNVAWSAWSVYIGLQKYLHTDLLFYCLLFYLRSI